MATKFLVNISSLIDIVFTKNKLSCMKITHGIRFLAIHRGGKGRGQVPEQTCAACNYNTNWSQIW